MGNMGNAFHLIRLEHIKTEFPDFDPFQMSFHVAIYTIGPRLVPVPDQNL